MSSNLSLDTTVLENQVSGLVCKIKFQNANSLKLQLNREICGSKDCISSTDGAGNFYQPIGPIDQSFCASHMYVTHANNSFYL